MSNTYQIAMGCVYLQSLGFFFFLILAFVSPTTPEQLQPLAKSIKMGVGGGGKTKEK